jgi:hypothetical protein
MSKQANGPGHNPLDGQAMGTTIKSCFVGAVSSFTAAVVKSALMAWLGCVLVWYLTPLLVKRSL